MTEQLERHTIKSFVQVIPRPIIVIQTVYFIRVKRRRAQGTRL